MSDPAFLIESTRLYISYLQPDNDAHCDFLMELYNTPEFIASIGGEPTAVTTREAARARLAGRFRDEHARNGYGTYLVSLKPDTVIPPSTLAQDKLAEATPIGTVSLMRGEEPNCYKAPDLGFAILPAHMRRGYAKEAATALLDYAEKERGVTAVLGLFEPNNEASKGVFKSLGFIDHGNRELRVFGGVVGAVWAKPGMDEDLSVYGL